MEPALADELESLRGELTGYLCRLVVRPQVAEELAQTTFLRAIEAGAGIPESPPARRAWLFKVATNLGLDELKRHGNWRETMVADLRDAVEADEALVGRSRAMAGTPETAAIAREHLVACLACSLRNLPERRAAALLLREVHGFSLDETAELLGAGSMQVKNWLQEARREMDRLYGASCALIAKQGVCHQCIELDGFFRAGRGSPLSAGAALDDRLRIAAERRDRPWGAWHRLVFALLDEIG